MEKGLCLVMLKSGKGLFRRLLSTKSLPFEGNLKRKSNDNKDLMLSILKLTTTKRETNNYLNKYSSFSKASKLDKSEIPPPLRLVVIKIKGNVLNYEESELRKFNKTLDYIQKLGASPLLLIDADFLHDRYDLNFSKIDNYLSDQYNYLNKCLEDKKLLTVTPVRCILSKNENTDIELDIPEMILNPLKQDQVPILFPYVFAHKFGREVIYQSKDYLKVLIQNLSKLNSQTGNTLLTVEKLIFIDRLGGPPSIERGNASHVYINLNQEYDRIMSELNIGHLSITEKTSHIKNLENLKDILTSTNNDLTGIITTLPIANENLNLNPIIYNILTDRTLVSSSLPITKFQNKQDITTRVSKTSIIRGGLEIHSFKKIDGGIDIKKFKHLIDTSFKRSLNLDHYLSRIEPILSQVIIVGDYEGIAIVTNETSPTTGEVIPYLDKFAVSREAQGSLNIADIIVNILRRDYKDGLLWRSRKVNPVNGWYFQRSDGSLNLQDSEFRIFWIGKGIDKVKLQTFVEIGKSIKPSWDK